MSVERNSIHGSKPGLLREDSRIKHFLFRPNTNPSWEINSGKIPDIIQKLKEDARVGASGVGICIVIEDVDPYLANNLATLLNVNTSFFHEHLAPSNFTSPLHEPTSSLTSQLPSRVCCNDMANVHYQRIVRLGGEGLSLNNIPYHLQTASNSKRRIRPIPFSDHVSGIARACFSIVRKRLENGCWICMFSISGHLASNILS